VSKGEATRQAVLGQAVEVASRLGLSGLTIGTLASQVDLSKSGLFAHFKSKEQLQLQVLAYARETFTDQVVRPALKAPRGEPRLRELFEGWLATSRDTPSGCLFVSAATEFDDQPGPVRDQLVRDHKDLEDSIVQMFRAGIGEGHLAAQADPEQFAHDLYGIMLGFFHAYRLIGDEAAERRTRRAFEDLLRNAKS
jgi:AcrR family transcriptional regulator